MVSSGGRPGYLGQHKKIVENTHFPPAYLRYNSCSCGRTFLKSHLTLDALGAGVCFSHVKNPPFHDCCEVSFVSVLASLLIAISKYLGEFSVDN